MGYAVLFALARNVFAFSKLLVMFMNFVNTWTMERKAWLVNGQSPEEGLLLGTYFPDIYIASKTVHISECFTKLLLSA